MPFPLWIRIGAAGLGVCLLVTGCLLFISDGADADVQRVSRLDTAAPAQIQPERVGTGALLVGKLKALEPPGPQGFVIYKKEQYLRTEREGPQKGREQWMALSVPKPRIAVEAEGIAVPICNRDYLMKNPPHRWQSDPGPVWRSVGDATERLTGFKSGDSLTADGVIAAGPDGLCLRALTIFAGGSGQYLESLREDVRTLKIVGVILAGFGFVVLAVVALLTTVGRRRAGDRNRPG